MIQILFIFILVFTLLGFLCLLHYTGSFASISRFIAPTPTAIRFRKGEVDCDCKSEKTGKSYNFCYEDPQNATYIGKKFDCAHLKILEKLNLVDNPGPFVNISKVFEKEIIFVSAISDDRFSVSVTSISAFYKFYPTRKFILYGLNLSEKYVTKMKDRFKNIEIRQFNTSGYPEYTNHWMEYRFKPLILAEVLKKYSNVWWMDANIKVVKPNMIELFFKEIAEKTNKKHNETVAPIYFFVHTGHSNYATMFPELLTYFPSNSMSLLKSKTQGAQLGANTIFLARTEYTIEVFKWWVLCALDEKCMNPPGAQVRCSFSNNRYEDFANCFRFDQSVLNLLLLNQFQDHNKYLSIHESLFSRI